MSSVYVVKLKFDDGWVDVSAITRLKEFSRLKLLYKALRPTIDSCNFKLDYDQTIISKLLLADYDIECEITKDGNPYFYGIVDPPYKLLSRTRVEWVDIQVNDNSFRLLDNINVDIQGSSIKLCDSSVVTAATEEGSKNSLLHLIMFYAGYTTEAWGYTLQTDTDIDIAYFTHLINKPTSKNIALDDIPYGGTWKEILTNVLFQYGYLYYFDFSGKIQLYNFNDTNVDPGTNVLNNTNMIGSITLDKKNPTYEAVEITWKESETIENFLLFQDLTDNTKGGTVDYLESGDTNPTNIRIEASGSVDVDGNPTDYWPSGTAINDIATTPATVFYNIDVGDGRDTSDIVAVLDASLDDLQLDGYHEWVISSKEVTPTIQVPVWGWVYNSRRHVHNLTKKDSWGDNGTSIRVKYDKWGCVGTCWGPFGTWSNWWWINYYVWTITGYIDGPGEPYDEDTSSWVYRGGQDEVVTYFDPSVLSFDLRIKNNSDNPVYIRNLSVHGDLVLRGNQNTTIDQYSGTTNKVFKYDADYLHLEADAQKLADSIYNYYRNSTFQYTTKSKTVYDPGDWVLVTDNNFQNVDDFPVENKRCLVVSRKDNEFNEEIIYVLEEYPDYEA